MRARELTIDGRRLEVVTHTPPGAREPAIVLLHEGLGSVALWKSFPAELAARTQRRTIVYSRYGHGEADVLDEPRAVNYMHREGEVVLPALITALGLDRPILLGHSDGASIALIAASAYPALSSALILEAPHIFVEAKTIASIDAARVAYRDTEFAQRLQRYHRDADRTFLGWNDIWLDPRFRDWNITPSLTNLRCPVLLVQGEDDEYGTVAQLSAIAANVSDTQTVLLAHCGHSPHRDQPVATLAAISNFLRRFDVPPFER